MNTLCIGFVRSCLGEHTLIKKGMNTEASKRLIFPGEHSLIQKAMNTLSGRVSLLRSGEHSFIQKGTNTFIR